MVLYELYSTKLPGLGEMTSLNLVDTMHWQVNSYLSNCDLPCLLTGELSPTLLLRTVIINCWTTMWYVTTPQAPMRARLLPATHLWRNAQPTRMWRFIGVWCGYWREIYTCFYCLLVVQTNKLTLLRCEIPYWYNLVWKNAPQVWVAMPKWGVVKHITQFRRIDIITRQPSFWRGMQHFR